MCFSVLSFKFRKQTGLITGTAAVSWSKSNDFAIKSFAPIKIALKSITIKRLLERPVSVKRDDADDDDDDGDDVVDVEN